LTRTDRIFKQNYGADVDTQNLGCQAVGQRWRTVTLAVKSDNHLILRRLSSPFPAHHLVVYEILLFYASLINYWVLAHVWFVLPRMSVSIRPILVLSCQCLEIHYMSSLGPAMTSPYANCRRSRIS